MNEKDPQQPSPDPWTGKPFDRPSGYPKPGEAPPQYPASRYPQPGYPQPGYEQGGYQQGGYQPGYPQPGYEQGGYQQGGYQPGYPQPGYEQGGYQQGGYQPGYPQPGYPQPGGYGVPAYPGGPGYAVQEPAGPPPERPATVRGAFWLWMVIMLVGIVANVLLFTGGYFDEVLAGAGGRLDPDSVQTARDIARIAAVVSVVVAVFIYVFFGLKMYLGRNWARIVLTVLGALAVLAGVSGNALTGAGEVDVPRPDGNIALGWVGVVLAVLALVLMYLPASNAYFAEVKRGRSRRR